MMRTTELEIINPLEYPEWDNLLLASKGHSFFHTSFWARVLQDAYGYRLCYIIHIKSGALSTLVPLMEVRSSLTGRRGVSLPFTDYCEPIVSDQDNWQNMLEFLKSYGKSEQWKYLELRVGEQIPLHLPFSSSFYKHTLDLSPDVDAVYAQLKKGTKGSIKKALKEDVTVTRNTSIDAVRTFYKLHCQTRKRKGVPPQPFYFFQKLYDHVISYGHGQVALASHQGRIIAGAVYLHFGNNAVYKFSASNNKYLHVQPNNLLMWETIKYYCRNGYRRLCFGRTDIKNEGLRAYKKGWGAQEYPIHYYKYDFKREVFVEDVAKSDGLYNLICRKTPVPLLKIAGSILYRHMG